MTHLHAPRDLYLERALAQPYERLAVALLVRAIRDSQVCQPKLAGEAAAWLHSPDAQNLMEMLSLDPDRLDAWLDAIERNDS